MERGKLDLDAPVAQYWPEFAAAGKDAITVRQLLSHQAGLPLVEGEYTLDAALDWDTVVERAVQARATRMLGLGLRLVEEFSDVRIPAHVLAAVDADCSMQQMARDIRAQLFTTFGAADSTETNLYNLRVMDRKRDAALSALRAIFVPTLPDWQALALPAPLHSLYYAYRPLRLSKIYWRRLIASKERNV